MRSWALAGLGVATVVCAAMGFRVLGGGLFALGLVGYLVWGRLRYQLALRRIAEARRNFDAHALRREVDAFARYTNELSPLLQELRFERAVSWMMEERFDEAERALHEVDPERLSPRSRLAWMGNLAFCHARLGRTAEAVREATDSARLAEKEGPEVHAIHLGILGAAHIHAGEPEQALPLLQEALQQGDPHPQLRTMRELYLGDALAALGRPDEARAAWARAQAAAPASPLARHAAERLSKAVVFGATRGDPGRREGGGG
jgi:tetratricopeptide (TPR) repeat protein